MKASDLNPDFTEENFRRVVDTLNTFMRNVSLENSFSGQVIENISIDSGVSKRVSHSLKIVPKYRIILRQDDNDALITDGDEIWNEKYISLKNQGPDNTVVTIFLLRR